MSKTIRETIDEAMHKMGFYDHPVTIGGSTSYVDEASPFAQIKKQINELPQELDNRLQDYLDNKAQIYVNVPQNNVQAYNQEVMNRINQGIQQPQGMNNWDGVATSAVTGSGEGMWGGINSAANAATLGLYGKAVDKYMDNSYSNLQNRLQQQANQAGLGDFNELANNAIDIGIKARLGKKF